MSLHFLLLEIDSVAYRRREKQILDEEKKQNYFSPQFDDHSATEKMSSCLDSLSSKESSMVEVVDPLDCDTSFHNHVTYVPENSNLPEIEGNGNVALENKLPHGCANGNCKEVSINHVLCAGCKQLLVQPLVLNCGHVFCKSCISCPMDGSLRCQVCHSSHPGGFPRVCLELDNFLLEKFPEEYAHRKAALQNKGHCEQGLLACAMQTEEQHHTTIWPIKNDFSWWREHGSKVQIHYRVGCDSCGMCPIVGKRYKCLDCKEAIGFDLCEDCHNTSPKTFGRFNQKHTPEHRFQNVQLNAFRNYFMWRAMPEQSQGDSYGSFLSSDVL